MQMFHPSIDLETKGSIIGRIRRKSRLVGFQVALRQNRGIYYLPPNFLSLKYPKKGPLKVSSVYARESLHGII